MRRIFTLIIFGLPMILMGQFGIRANYSKLNYPGINKVYGTSNEVVLNPQFEAGIDYWFRLKEKRLEFMPELAYNSSSSTISEIDVKHTMFLFYVNAHVYPFDFAGDCNCPTFSKEGNSIKKGFFIQLAPVIGVSAKRYGAVVDTVQGTKDLTYGIRGGLGVDFGVSDIITITPIVSYAYLASQDWSSLSRIASPTSEELTTNVSGLQAGIRLGLRFDYKGSKRRR